MTNRAEELITQLEAEIVKRDARIAELERQGAALAASYCDGVIGDSYGHTYCKYKAELATLKANQPSSQEWPKQECPVTGAVTDVDPSDMGAQQPRAGVAQGIDIDAAAKALAKCMDYPWDFMPERGRESMRKHAQSVIDARTAELESVISGLWRHIAELEAHAKRQGDAGRYLEGRWCDADAELAAPKSQPSDGVAERAVFDAWFGQFGVGSALYPESTWQGWQARARLNPCRAQAVPDGYVVVPVEPTQAMFEAGRTSASGSYAEKLSMAGYWRAMLAAAPSDQQKESGQ